MSFSNFPNIVASGVPLKNLVFCLDERDGMFKALSLGIFTSGSNYNTGSSIIVTAVNKTGTFPLVSFPAKKAVFINQRDPMYRVYKTNETGLDYLRWVPVNSGGALNGVAIEGIKNLNEISIQVDSTSLSNGVSGVCIAYS